MPDNFKEVFFFKYCAKCKHSRKKENEEPCATCLEDHHNPNSHRPTFFEFEEDKKK